MAPQRRNNAPLEQQLSLFQRSVRSVPGSGEQWARYIRFLVVWHSYTSKHLP